MSHLLTTKVGGEAGRQTSNCSFKVLFEVSPPLFIRCVQPLFNVLCGQRTSWNERKEKILYETETEMQ